MGVDKVYFFQSPILCHYWECTRDNGAEKNGGKLKKIGVSNLSPHTGGQNTCFISYDCQGSLCKGRVHLLEIETKLTIIYIVLGRSR